MLIVYKWYKSRLLFTIWYYFRLFHIATLFSYHSPNKNLLQIYSLYAMCNAVFETCTEAFFQQNPGPLVAVRLQFPRLLRFDVNLGYLVRNDLQESSCDFKAYFVINSSLVIARN